jgi:acyl carrier protein
MKTVESRVSVEDKVIAVVNEMVADWGLDLPGGITKDTRLIEDLELESIDIVQFAIAIERAFDRKGLPFEQLFLKDGTYVDDIAISEVTDFLCTELAVAPG